MILRFAAAALLHNVLEHFNFIFVEWEVFFNDLGVALNLSWIVIVSDVRTTSRATNVQHTSA